MSTKPGRNEGAATVTARRPGEWPAGCRRPEPGGATWMRLEAERARREIFLGAVRADLEEQPSPRAVRAAARRWNAAITQLADEIAQDMTRRQQEADAA